MTPVDEALFAAIFADDTAKVRELLAQGARCDETDTTHGVDAVGLTELAGGEATRLAVLEHAAPHHLMAAAYLGRADLVAARLDAGDDPNPLLVHALHIGDEGLAQALRMMGATLSLTEALQTDSLDELEAWLADGDPNASVPLKASLAGTGATIVHVPLLHVASLADAQDCVERLFDAGANTNRWTAAGFGQLDELARWDDKDRPDPIGMTPLHHAIFGHQTAAVVVLLAGGADVERSHDTWPDGPGAMHLAAGVDAPHDILSALVQAGARLDRPSTAGTPLEVAELNGAEGAVAWLSARQLQPKS
ncbi:MAG: ankyrin repeat domain-containing protein [Proteobacteria bacterium]|nr:ankyrin repeat domain-containing protein [Pseudomonadota bacterium]MCP4918764.1 ankyrin repeat domain-containing protein [Pseudomonadota bacterium]